MCDVVARRPLVLCCLAALGGRRVVRRNPVPKQAFVNGFHRDIEEEFLPYAGFSVKRGENWVPADVTVYG